MFDEAGEDELLLAGLAELGAAGGMLGAGAVGVATGGRALAGSRAVAAAGRGGERGAIRGIKWTKKDVGTATVQLAGPGEAAFGHVRDALTKAGRVVGVMVGEDGSYAARAVLGVGVGGLNPAVVTATVTTGPDGVVRAQLRAAGREGLIKQHPATKALAKVTTLLSAVV